MCVIIDRQPGVTIPSDKLDLACDINKHGYGIAYPKDGKLYFIRSVKNNDAKEIADQLQKLKDHRVFLHLRHATVGKVNLENSHPFHILTRKKHGVDLAWMHNGTLWEYKPTNENESDTHLFHTQMMIPLAIRITKFSGKKILDDPIFAWALKKETGYSSIFFVFDGYGNTFITNKDKGKQFEGWWSSNDYSFNPRHVRSSFAPYNNGFERDDPWSAWTQGVSEPWSGMDETQFFMHSPDDLNTTTAVSAPKETKETKAPVDINPESLLQKYNRERPVSVKDDIRLKYECAKIGELVDSRPFKIGESLMPAGTDSSVAIRDLKVLKQSFLELSGLKSLTELGRLTEQDLIDTTQQYPQAIARLVLEQMDEIRALTLRNTNQATIIAGLRETEVAGQ